ncbi:hypothetical protein Cni_G27331 [Canna indica]|uniref:C2H2-type domain-containing protein n=1 Tax=Canna indica TaxID=4628 RepID=A0AAQ3L1K9_9LILI|nr:hypothetical protein Cni_G27331 [Canna indica]
MEEKARRSKESQEKRPKHRHKESRRQQTHNEEEKRLQHEAHSPSAKEALKSFFICRHQRPGERNTRHIKRIGCSGSICKLRDMQRPETKLAEPCKPRVSGSGGGNTERTTTKQPLISGAASKSSSHSSSSHGGSFRRMHLRKFSGCYECQMVLDPISLLSRDSSLRSNICPCPECGEIFMKPESLEIHQAMRHAVSELGPEDTSRNIVQIIFQSSWLKKQTPACKIDRILKVHNTSGTITRFEDYRDSIKIKAGKLAKKHPRCTADGNELLRFHRAALGCSIGHNGASGLCSSTPQCDLCGIIRDGFKIDMHGRIQTMATSGRAHDAANVDADEHAMLVCRVIAGRVKRKQDDVEEYDSVAGATGIYSNLDELFVFNPRAILPCFVVIYRS